METKDLESVWDKLTVVEKRFQDYEYPKVSIIIPTFDSAEKISLTLDSILDQDYTNFEVIVIDACSTDRTIEVIKNYREDRISIYSVTGYQRYEMLNRGIAQATGEYLNFLFPGDFYIHHHVLLYMMNIALDNEKPHLVYCGTLLRDGKTEPKILFRKLNLSLLKKGQQPTSLQSCWFRNDTFRDLGKFPTGFNLRGGFDLMCHFCLNPNFRMVATNKVLTDYDLRFVTRKMVMQHFVETFKTIYKYFGIFSTIRWLCHQKDFRRYIRLWWRSIKVAFLGR